MNSKLLDPRVQQRAQDLLSRMTLEQKVGQMTQTERMTATPDDVRTFHLGSILSGGGSCPGANVPADWVAMNDAYWAASMASGQGRVAIPILYGVDAIHGNANVLGATVFPHNIGLGAAHDPELMERIARVTAREILATGVEWTFAPTLAVARNDRWGRTYESFSEDPSIVVSYAARVVAGLQGDLGTESVLACAKHFVGDGGTTDGVDQGDTAVSEAELERLHLAPYLPALGADVMTVMVSLSSWNMEKCHGSRYLLTDVLKGRLGFPGFVISDWDGIDYVSEDYGEAVAISINAGIDMVMVPEKWKRFIDLLTTHVRAGTVPMARIDDAVRRILSVKLAYGLFEKQRPADRPWSGHPSFGSREHRKVAREAVRKSLVLLKNDGGILPLDRGARILVAGKNAHNKGHQCGGFTIAWQGTSGNDVLVGGTSIWEGIHAVAPGAVLSADGADADPERFDVAVVVIGERPYAEGQGDIRGAGPVARGSQPLTAIGTTQQPYAGTLALAQNHPEDLATITRITAKGIPVVAVLVSGRPLAIDPELTEARAFVAAWLPGSEGQGVADVLFGDHDFQGRLAFSWPRTAADNVNRGDAPDAALFPYGFGLHYDVRLTHDGPRRESARPVGR